MFKVLDKLLVGNIYCVSIEGDTSLLKNGLELIDEKDHIFVIETVAMTHYQNTKDFDHMAELVLSGDVENMGKCLSILRKSDYNFLYTGYGVLEERKMRTNLILQCETCANWIKGNALHCKCYENEEKPQYVMDSLKECPSYHSANRSAWI